MGENVKLLKKENDKLRDQVKSLSEDFQRFKDKMAAKVSKEVSPSSCESPSVQDVQFLSEGYDDLLKSKEEIAREFLKLKSRLESIKSNLNNIAKAIDDIMSYSYQYNIKIIGVPQASDRETSVETANLCLRIFNGIGANVAISDIDIAQRVQPRNSNRGLRHQPIICKFVRRMAREQVMAARNNANQLTADDLGLSPSTEIRRVAIFCHMPPRLQELLHLAKIHQTNYSYKYCWAKESAIFLRQTDCSRAIKLLTKEDLDDLRMKEPNNSTTQDEESG